MSKRKRTPIQSMSTSSSNNTQMQQDHPEFNTPLNQATDIIPLESLPKNSNYEIDSCDITSDSFEDTENTEDSLGLELTAEIREFLRESGIQIVKNETNEFLHTAGINLIRSEIQLFLKCQKLEVVSQLRQQPLLKRSQTEKSLSQNDDIVSTENIGKHAILSRPVNRSPLPLGPPIKSQIFTPAKQPLKKIKLSK
ncbi:hypothetical protein [Crucivirus-527]|nr:hypothetical protein [Crucivirus-527]QMW69024.1 hypothetical protein [Crucivirus-528]